MDFVKEHSVFFVIFFSEGSIFSYVLVNALYSVGEGPSCLAQR